MFYQKSRGTLNEEAQCREIVPQKEKTSLNIRQKSGKSLMLADSSKYETFTLRQNTAKIGEKASITKYRHTKLPRNMH